MTIKIIKKVEPKKKYLIATMIGVCLIFGNIIGCGNSSDETIGTTELQEEITEETPAVEEDVPETEEMSQEDDRVFVGDTFTVYWNPDDGSSTPALEVTVTDVGTTTDTIMNSLVVYAELDVKNIFDDEVSINQCLEGFYGDDYALDHNPTYYMENSLDGVSVAPGRKAKGRYYASCPNYDQLNVIEMSFAERSIVIKDPSMVNSDEMSVPENADTSELTYGTYVYHDTEHGVINTAEVGFASGEGANYIYIDNRGEGGHGVIEFVGYFQEANEDNSYTVIQPAEDSDYDYNAEVRCTFVEGGLNIEVISSEIDTLYDAAGYYELESELNLDEVS